MRSAAPEYVTLTLPSFPGATLVALHQPDRSIIGLGAHYGPASVGERIKDTHRLWTRMRAARIVAETDAGAILGHVRSLGGRPFAAGRIPPKDPDAERFAVHARLSEALAIGDPYRATRQIETHSLIDGDADLYDLVFAARARVDEIEGHAETSLDAARLLEAASPGPRTTLARMLAEIRGLPAPDDAIAFGTDRHGDPTAVLGSLVLTTQAGPCHPIEVTVVASYGLASADFDPDGTITFASVDLKVVHDPATRFGDDVDLYRDEAVRAEVIGLLSRRGFPVDANWSESGRQTAHSGDMDVDMDLCGMLFPDIVAAERAKALGTAPSP